jgi:hypothetical protein
MLEDAAAGGPRAGQDDIVPLLRNASHTGGLAGVAKLNEVETTAGKAVGRPRVKHTTVADMLAAIRHHGVTA